MFDPVQDVGVNSMYYNYMYDAQVYIGPHGYQPGLAQTWSFPDQSTFEMTLRKGLVFQDGTPLNAQAVQYDWNRLIATPAGIGPGKVAKNAALAAMTSVDVVNDQTVIVHFSQPVAGQFLQSLTAGGAQSFASPTALKAGEASFDQHPIGAGPYKLVSYTPNQSILLERWSGYWNPAAQKSAFVKIVFLPRTGAEEVTAVASGTVDLVSVAGPDAVSAKAQGLEVYSFTPVLASTFIEAVCATKPPLNNLAARQAVEYAINRSAYLGPAFAGYAVANSTLPPPGYPLYPRVTDPYSYDPAKARQLLQGAGLVGSKIVIISDNDPASTGIGQVMQQQLDAVGFNAQVDAVPSAFAQLRTTNWNILTQLLPDSTSAPSVFLLPGQFGNTCNNDFPSVTQGFQQVQDPLLTPQQQQEAWNNLQTALYNTVEEFTVANPDDVIIANKRVGGVTGAISEGNPWNMATLYIKKS
jgi:ABC-type transport system substrate-binding protein